MPLLDTRHKKKSFTLTTLLLSVLLLILFYIGLTYMDPPIENGISVNFGTTDFGDGKVQPKEKIRSEPLNTPPVEPNKQEEAIEEEVIEEASEEVAAKEVPSEKILTQESEEAIKIKQAKEVKKKAEDAAKAVQKKKDDAIKKEKAKAAKIARQKRDAEEKARKEQEAKKKRLDELMGGLNKSDGTASGSEGDDNRAGDKGQPDGDPYVTSYYGSPGSGSATGGYGLNGRSLVNKGKVKQDCNQAGIVVVKIIVGPNGKVVSATPGVKGTTNNSPCLLAPARKTAFMHKWNLDANAPSQQVGFVVVNFKLGECWMFAQLPMYQQKGKIAYNAKLSTIQLLVKHLEYPEKKFKSIHVGGTNGKGSSSHILASVLQEAGYKVGLYTSPHLKDFRERIRINGKPVSKKFVVDFIEDNRFLFLK